MAMLDRSNIIDLSTRSRRTRHDSGKIHDADCDRSLELAGIVDVLSGYRNYEGGINCSKCGKLYKSRVCFIKHLWEHSVYWDRFPGTKNHERVLSIQAALILYSGIIGVSVKEAERLMDLLVTSPNVQETTGGASTSSTHMSMDTTAPPKHCTPKKRPSPPKMPKTPRKKMNATAAANHCTPQKRPSSIQMPKTPRKKPRLW